MKGSKPKLENVIPMKGDMVRHVPDAPDWMSAGGSDVWRQLAPLMVQKERLDPMFATNFAVYCEAAADFINFTGEMAAFGSYFVTVGRHGKQEKRRAVWQQRQDAIATMQCMSALFGLTPVDEQRLGTAGQGDLLDLIEKQLNGNGSD